MSIRVLCTGLFASLAIASSIQSQACPSSGDATLRYVAKDKGSFGSGSTGTLLFRGEPDTVFWLKCCMDRGTRTISAPGIGSATFCLDLSSGCFTLDANLSSTGRLNLPVRIPYGFTERELLCCQWVGIHPRNNNITTSNVVCLCANVDKCDKVNQLAYATCFDAPSKFPVTITSTFEDGKSGKVTVSYDPKSPPKFPLTNGLVSIEGIALVAGEVCVTSRIDAGKDSKGNLRDLSSSTDVRVSLGATMHREDIHTSCSRPLAAGMVFGEFTLTDLVDTAGCTDPCDGGINCLGYCATLDAPALPARITSSVAKKDGTQGSRVSFSYDPKNPPKFPIQNGKLYVDSVSIEGGKLKVCSRVDNGKNSKGELQKFPASEMLFRVAAGSKSVSQLIHVSCSKPIGRGSVFGAFKITKLDSVNDGKCEGGINILGYRNTFDAPAKYPVAIASRVAKKDGSAASVVTVSYDPSKPPAFPLVSSDGKLVIDNIKVVQGKIQIVSFAVNGRDSKGNRLKFVSNEMRFTVSAGSASASELIHLSCSQPIAKGSKFGNFEILALVSAK